MSNNTEAIAAGFQSAVQELERTGDIDCIAPFFSQDAELSNLGAEQGKRGAEGVRQFWTAYLDQFSTITSEFREAIAGQDAAVLEWTSTGNLKDGSPIRYTGVSILRFDEGSKVREFQTYYDSAAFVAKAALLAHT